MNERSTTGRNLIIAAVALALIGAAGYYYLGRGEADENLLVSVPAEAGGAVDGDLLTALRSLRKLTLDDSIFKDKSWATLFDFGQTLSPQPKGRPNPFAPFDASAPVSGTTTPAR
jgi:hypothetical protein